MPKASKQNTNFEEVTSYVCKIDEAKRLKLENLLKEKDWTFSEAPYAFWKAENTNLNIIAYHSEKIVIQGKGTGEFVIFTLEPEITGEALLGYQDEKEKKKEQEEDFISHAGTDESGKGDLFGPLVIAAVYLDENSANQLKKAGVKDSKEIKSDAKIAFLAGEIKRKTRGSFSVVKIGPAAYNKIYSNFGNLNVLLAWGHARAIENLLEKQDKIPFIISDKFGSDYLIKNALMKKGKKIKLIQKTKAESDIAVAAASILARDIFISEMKRLGEKTPLKTLPRGGGKEAQDALAKIYAAHGKDALLELAKAHFKPVQALIKIADTQKEKLLNELNLSENPITSNKQTGHKITQNIR
jgi:ribonuclease HIII